MFKCLLLLLASALAQSDDRKPLYKYRYETEDVMKTAASSVPVHGYHVIEGGYYPEGARYTNIPKFGGFGSGFGGGYAGDHIGARQFLSPIGGQFGGSRSSGHIGSIGGSHSGSFGSIDVGRSDYPHHHLGGEYIDKNLYDSSKKLSNDEVYEKSGANKQEEGKHGQEGYNQGQIVSRNNKGDSGYYKDEEGGKKVVEDGKTYNGGQHFNQEGKNTGEQKQKQGHKKGHVIKGFKTSHHKDESGKTEEYYDEENDEGDNFNLNGKTGSFGETAQSAFKGGHENGNFNANQGKKQTHYDTEHAVDNSNADQGRYGQQKSYGSGQSYGSNNGVDHHSLLGHQENSKMYKHQPYYYHY